MRFPVVESTASVAKHREVFIYNVLPEGAIFHMFGQWVGHINLDAHSCISPLNGGASNGINF